MMTQEQIEQNICIYMCDQWAEKQRKNGVAPLMAIGFVEREGPNYGVPHVCTPPDIDPHRLATLLDRLADDLRKMPKRRRIPEQLEEAIEEGTLPAGTIGREVRKLR
jgi:hypothetical protein